MIKLLIAIVFASILMWAFQLRREKEVDKAGNPCVCFLGPKFGMLLCGLAALIVGLVELNDPVNYLYSGNLLLLAYIPISISFLIFFLSVYYWNFRIALGKDYITSSAWPFQSKRYNLSEMTSLRENKISKNASDYILHFSEGQHLNISGLLSGQSYFISALRTIVNSSQLTNPDIEIPIVQHDDNSERLYKFPIRRGILWIAIGIVFSIVPFFGAAPGKTVQLSGYLILFGVTFFMCALGVYQLLYSVVIKTDRIIVRGLSTKEYLISDIVSVEVVPVKGSHTARITLQNRNVLGIDGELNDFKDMVQIVKSRAATSR